ncbi:GAF domain-containing protein [Actinopolymorpha alba]|uniref:GAF domain-containing protein n=1 Tax=Actinopolymorpha alba TaxID=533267 RepID=UPI00036CE9D6|nr:GAF domain-containing protein [Actinopolymorpha alba]
MRHVEPDDRRDERGRRRRPVAGSVAWERLSLLTDAVTALGADLDLSHVLERVVQSACTLVDARQGALLLLSPDRRRSSPDRWVAEFVAYGRTEADRRAFADQARFAPLISLFLTNPAPLRIGDAGVHPVTRGLVRNSGTTTSVLAVPILYRDELVGQLCLAKDGDAAFSEDDEQSVTSLAAAGAIAIQNARLLAQERRRQQWLEAATGVTRSLLGELDLDRALRVVTRQLREVSGADYATITLIDRAAPAGGTVLTTVDGLGLEHLSGSRVPLQGLVATIARTGKSVVSDDLTRLEGYGPPPEWRETLAGVGLGMLMPLAAHGEVFGILFAAWLRGSPHERTAVHEADLVETFAGQAALALKRGQARQDRDRLLILEDRDRIARNLHDVVIQRLFGIGLCLQSTVGLGNRPEVQRRVTTAIDELSETTRQVHSAIDDLHSGTAGCTPFETAAVLQ